MIPLCRAPRPARTAGEPDDIRADASRRADGRLSCVEVPSKLAPLAGSVIAAATLAIGCGASKDAGAQHAPAVARAGEQPAAASMTVRSAGLTVTLRASPAFAAVGSPVAFLASAYERHARGALAYRLNYGDGTSAPPSAVPLFCLAGKGLPVHKSWRFLHRYSAARRYLATLTVRVNCSRDHATAAVTVIAAHR